MKTKYLVENKIFNTKKEAIKFLKERYYKLKEDIIYRENIAKNLNTYKFPIIKNRYLYLFNDSKFNIQIQEDGFVCNVFDEEIKPIYEE
jgi:hypothetical protein